jgi:hypothetical protein
MAMPAQPSRFLMPLRRFARACARRLASEQGFAVPTVMLMTVAALGMASVAVMTSVQGQSGTVRDQQGKTALGAAESGVSQALLHYNRGTPPCEPAVEGEWCGPVTGMSVNGAQVAYWARVTDADNCDVVDVGSCVDIVSVGTVDGVTRRVEVFASSMDDDGSGPGGPFSAASVLSRESLTLDANASIHTGSATNGHIELHGNARQCGPASVGVGKELKPPDAAYYADPSCSTNATSYGQKELILPAVVQGDAPTNNDNSGFFSLDTTSGNKGEACWSGLTAAGKASKNCGSRELYIGHNSAVTLNGTIYSFCKLTLASNATLYVASGTQTTIYFDSPENCGYTEPVTQLTLDSKTRITSADGKPSNLAMLFVGSTTIPTEILLKSNTAVDGPCDQNFVIYAPESHVELNSNSRFCGAIAGKSVHLDANAHVWAGSGTEEFNLPGWEAPETPAHYAPYRFVECTATAATAGSPNVGC